MLQCIFLISDSGEVILEKQLKGQGHRVDRSICSWFWDHYVSQGCDLSKLLPVIASPTHYLFHVFRGGIVFLGCTQVEMSPLMAIEFLCRVADILSDYLGGLNEDLMKDNFVIVYQLLDEMIDSGFPLTTEPNILRELITPPTSCVPWRTTDIKYKSNEVYINLVEEIDVTISSDGNLVKCEVYGEIQVKSSLPGFPDMNMTFTNPSILNDVRFHPCIRLRQWESSQALSFVPPDGQFKLMSYRIKKLKDIPIYVKPQFSSSGGNCRMNVFAGIRNDPGRAIESVVIEFDLPPHIAVNELTCNLGTVNILVNKVCTWSIGRMPKDKSPCLSGTLVLNPGVKRLRVFPVFRIGFKIMGIALSHLQVDMLNIKNTGSSTPYKGFKAQTSAGDYQVLDDQVTHVNGMVHLALSG